METRRKKEVSEIIGGLGMPAMKYSEYLKELVIKIVREHPETDMDDIYVSKDLSLALNYISSTTGFR